MSGSNSYTGGTTITAGTLQIGNGTSGEYLASPSISNSGVLVFNHADALAYSGAIGGGGSLTKLGTGCLTFGGPNTNYGPTTVSSGTLALGQTSGIGATLGASAVTVNSGAAFAVTPGVIATSNNSIGSSLTLNPAAAFSMADGVTTIFNVNGSASLAPSSGTGTTLTFDIGGGTSDVLAIGGLAMVGAANAAIAINLVGSANWAGSYTIITAPTGGLTPGNFTLPTVREVAGGTTYSLSLVGNGTSETVNVVVGVPTLYYNAGGGSAALNAVSGSNTNFSLDSAGGTNAQVQPTSATDVYFTAGNVTSPQTIGSLGVTSTFNSLNFTSDSPAIILSDSSGNTLTVNAAITSSGTSNQTVNVPIILGGAVTIANSGSSPLTLGGGVAAGSNLLSVAGSGQTTISGTNPLTTSANVTVNSGAGPVTISAPIALGGASTFTNNSSGTLTLGGGVAAGSNLISFAGSGATTISGSNAFTTAAGATVNSGAGPVTISAPVNLSGTSTFTNNSNSNLSVSGVITGAGGLTKNGTGMLALSGSNGYTGNTTISAGTLSVSAIDDSGVSNLGYATGAAAITFSNTATLEFSGASATTARGLTLTSSATLGTIQVDSGSLTLNGTISGTWTDSTIIKSGSGVLTLSGSAGNPNDLFSVTGGTLNLAKSSGFAANGISDIASGAMVQVQNANTQLWGGGTMYASNTAPGVQIKSGGTFNVNGFNVTVDQLGGNNGLVTTTGGSVTLTVGTNANYSNIYGGTIADGAAGTGVLSLLKAGGGMQTLSGTNTYSGTTLISAGTLALGGGRARQNSTLDTSGTGTLSFLNLTAATFGGLQGKGSLSLSNTASSPVLLSAGNNNANTTFSGILSGGSLSKIGTGMLTLSGTNTYSGATTVNGGTLDIGPTGSVASQTINVGSAGILTVESGGAITGTSALAASGTVNFNNATRMLGTLNGPVTGMVNLSTTNLVVNGGGTFAGSLQDGVSPGGLTVAGGLLGLGGTNTYSGPTTVSGGTLDIAPTGSVASQTINVGSAGVLTVESGGAISGTPALAASGTVNFNNPTKVLSTLNGPATGVVRVSTTNLVVSGGGAFAGTLQDGASPGGLTVAGGMLGLSGTNTYSGPTAVSGGTLQLGPSGSLGATAVSVGPGAVFAPLIGSSLGGSLTLATSDAGAGATLNLNDGVIGNFNLAGSLDIAGGASVANAAHLDLEIGATAGFIDTVTVGSAVSFSGSNAVVVSITPLGSMIALNTGNYTFLTAGSGLNSAFALSSNTISVGSRRYDLAINSSGGTAKVLTVSPFSVSGTWGNTTGGNWSTPGNWQGSSLPSDGNAAIFGSVIGSNSATITLDTSPTLSSLTFDNSAASYTLAALGTNSLTLGSGGMATITVLGGTHTISAPVVLAESLVVSTAGGASLQLSGSVSAPWDRRTA